MCKLCKGTLPNLPIIVGNNLCNYMSINNIYIYMLLVLYTDKSCIN